MTTEPTRLILLLSNGVSDRQQATHQARAKVLLNSRRTPYVEVDGMDLSQKERRNELFQISGIRGQYPQFFLETKSGVTTFLGTWDDIEALNDKSSYNEHNDEIMENHPEFPTWDRVFANIVASFD